MKRSHKPLIRISGRVAASLAIILCSLSIGCISLPGLHWHKETPPTGSVSRILGTWENHVVFTPDAVNGGRNLPGLAARIYLFSGDQGFPVEGNGSVEVDLYDVTGLPPGQQPRLPLERWTYDKENLKRLIRKDMIGWGYTIFLPWSTYRPEINQVTLVLSYTPEKGAPVYAPHFTMSLNSPHAVAPVVTQSMLAGPPSGRGTAGDAGAPGRAAVNPPHATPPPSTGPTRISLPGSRNSVFSNLVR
jgi:hypothetical protein